MLASDKLLIDGSTGVKPLIAALANQYAEAADNPEIVIGEGLRPNDRIQALLDGNIDIAMASHGIDAERLYRQGLKVHKIAVTASFSVRIAVLRSQIYQINSCVISTLANSLTGANSVVNL
jgi:ABC-type phosphate transport system substrate-binding protein